MLHSSSFDEHISFQFQSGTERDGQRDGSSERQWNHSIQRWNWKYSIHSSKDKAGGGLGVMCVKIEGERSGRRAWHAISVILLSAGHRAFNISMASNTTYTEYRKWQSGCFSVVIGSNTNQLLYTFVSLTMKNGFST